MRYNGDEVEATR